MNRHARGSFSSRRPVKTPRELRADWTSAVELAARLAAVAADDVPDPAFGQNLVRLTCAVRDLDAVNFPLAAASAQTMARAFLLLARDFSHPAWPAPARTACAPFLAAGAAALDRLLAELRSREADSWRGHTGERD